MPSKPSIRFEDLGLTTPVPHLLASTRQEKKKEKHELKKERSARQKLAEEHLSHEKNVVEKHKLFAEKEAFMLKKEKQERKKSLQDLQRSTRYGREVDEENKKQEATVAQQKYISGLVAKCNATESFQRDVQEKLREDSEKLIGSAPKNIHVAIQRRASIEMVRKELPVLREEQAIVEAINNCSRSCVLICGETGSGKTTQIPQFLWECGYGDKKGATFGREGTILVTEPRRVAAVSMARRVAEELNVIFGEEVCYHVRYDNNLSDKCKLKFATEGIVLKEIQADFLLKKYSVIIVDEAHERSVAGDILVGLLSRIVPLRNDLYLEDLEKNNGLAEQTSIKPLKLVIMSATMRVSDFKENRRLFPTTPPLINVEARRFPVTNHFAKRTELRNYLDEAFEKVCQIHKKLPPGGILIFLSTQHEIELLCERLRSYYKKTKIEYSDHTFTKHSLLRGGSEKNSSDSDVEESADETEAKDEFGLRNDDYALEKTDENIISTHGKRLRDDDANLTEEGEVNGELNTLHVLPLYALLDFRKQQEVFCDPPSGKRLCVVATNVAETSITIPNIRYVVDCGRVKTKIIDENTGASCFRIEWTSQASAEQRSGRAGRVGPGHCYRLYSTAVFSNLMPNHSSPEILRTSLENVVLLMKHLGIDHVGSFPFPTPPKIDDLKKALHHLMQIGAVESSGGHRITKLGKRLIAYPISPRFSRVIVEALNQKVPKTVLSMIIFITAILSTTTSVFTGDGNRMKWKTKASRNSNNNNNNSNDDHHGNINYNKGDDDNDERVSLVHSLLHSGSDLLTSLKAFGVYLNDSSVQNCTRYCLIQKSLYEAHQLSEQLFALSSEDATEEQINDTLDATDFGTIENTQVYGGKGELILSRNDEIKIRKLFIYGFVDQIARRATIHECRYHGVEYKDNKATKAPYILLGSSTILYIHPTSSIARTFPPPEYVSFGFLQRTVRSDTKIPTTMMLCLTIVTKEWLRECGVPIE